MFRPLRLILVVLMVSSCAMAQNKKLVAVLDFDYGTVHNAVMYYFGSDQDIGKGISLLLEQKLVNDGKYRLIDRNSLDKILKEQNFSNSDRADASTAAKIGHILGVSAIITGSITQFGRDDKSFGTGGGGYGFKGFGFGGVHKNDAKAEVNVTAKLIDVNSGEILAAVTGTGQSERKSFGLGGGGGNWHGGGGGQLDMGSSNFGNTIIGEATNKAVADLGQQLDDKAASLPTVKVEYSGLVADVEGSTVILNVGSKVGVKVGDHINISRKIKDIKDPSTGAVIKTLTSDLGTATVTQVDDSSATATFAGSGAVQVGDIAKSQ